jgi:hypothetical protein
MNATLDAWNKADEAVAFDAMIACCGATRWALAMVALRPIAGILELSEAADRVWATMNESDWMEAFACHPRIGERKAAHAVAKSAAWSRQEQASVRGKPRAMFWPSLPREMRATRSASVSPISCAPPARPLKRCSQSLNRRLANRSRSRVARGRRTATPDHADSSGKVACGMSGITTHVLDTVLGKPAAGIAVRLDKLEGGSGSPFRWEAPTWTAVAANLRRMPKRAHTASPLTPSEYLGATAAPAFIRNLNHLCLQRHGALSPAGAVERQQLHNLSRKLNTWPNWVQNRYGKSRVRLSRITRHGDTHEFNEWSVQVLLEGDFDASFTEADNSKDSANRHNEEHRLLRCARFQRGNH